MAQGLYGSTQASSNFAPAQLVDRRVNFLSYIFIKAFGSSIFSSEFETRRNSSDNWLIILVLTGRYRFFIVFNVQCLTEARFRMENIFFVWESLSFLKFDFDISFLLN